MTSTVDDSSLLHLRVRQVVESYPEPSILGACDCTSYSYFLLSIVLLTLGTTITVSALGATEHIVFSHLGHMWLVGPICICCGTMVAIRSVLYLRRKSIIKLLQRQRALLRLAEVLSFQELAAQSQNRGGPPGNEVYMTASTLTLPPTYDMIVSQGVPIDSATVADPPPPSYMEAMRLVEQEKANRDRTAAAPTDERDSADKETV
ncbi:Hypothetical protein NTJ_12147 [Nesidiocoris tenuis]|uniref:Uncharacterized protein n=1 Tax=Nesidiocoris tenuis TaxID=355587 RepID=A0ABN7B7Z5_9HEMI|nr:Hypothetical protein NTJ_12147 [Nesidiocoris tenuis]